MKILFILFSLFSFLYSEVYYAKVEPYEIRKLSSNVTGLVVFANESLVGSSLSQEPFIKIDSKLDEDELEITIKKLAYLNDTLKYDEEILKNQAKIIVKKEKNYEIIKELKIKSTFEKDKSFYDVLTTKNQYLTTQNQIINLKIEIDSLKLKKPALEKSINDKKIRAKDFVLYELFVKVGQMVNISTPLAEVADLSRGKLVIYLDAKDTLASAKKVVYIDGVKTDYKLSRVLKISDATNISKYEAQIIISSPKIFSKLVKVELRDE